MLPLFAVVLPVILLFCGLSIDVGLLELKKLQMQTAADAAALGAELEWETGYPSNVPGQAMADAAANGYTNGVNNVTITVNNPPPSGDYAGRYDVQYVTITQTVNTIFMGALNGGKATVSVSAAALMPPCGYLMNTSGISNAYTLNITNTVLLPSQGMYSRCPVYIKPNIYLTSTESLDQYAINATGTAAQSSLNTAVYAAPNYAALTVTDPLANVTQPTASACSHTNFVAASSQTLNPGTYCGSVSGSVTTPGMTLTGSGTMTFNPGLYVITGGLHATGGTLNGNGVTFFFTHVSGNTTSHGYGQVIFDGVSQIYLNAPSTSANGALSTILFFTDRSWVHTAAQDFQLNDAEYRGSYGIWYVTGTGVQLTAKSSTPFTSTYLGLVTDSVFIDSSTLNLFSDFSSINAGVNTGVLTTANPFRTRAVLIQ